MGWTKVELTKEEEEALKGGNFFKFAVGTKLFGKFLRTQEQTGQYKKAGCLDYVFRAQVTHEDGSKTIEEVIVNTGKTLNAQLGKCGLKPGYAVKIVCTGEIDIGQPNKMKTFDVEYDANPPSPKGAAAPPPPPPKPDPAGGDDDVPF